TRPQAYAEALDLVPERFDLEAIGEEWASKDFTRRRRLLVARRFGVPVAAAVLESADDGVHLFRLLDSVRLFPLATGGVAALAAQASSFYLAMNKRSFVVFLEDDTSVPPGLPSGYEDLGLADYVILSAEHLHELLEHVYAVTAPRAPGSPSSRREAADPTS